MKPSLDKLAEDLLARLRQDDPNWVEEAQDKSDEIVEAAEAVLKEAGYTEDHEEWGDLVDELSGEVTWSPGHFAKTVVLNTEAMKKKS